MLVTWEYTDGRLPPGRTVETSAQKLHHLLVAGRPIIIRDGAEVYEAFCAQHGHDPIIAADPSAFGPHESIAPRPVAAVAEPEPAPDESEEAEEVSEAEAEADESEPDVTDGWPEGYTYEQRGAYYDVTAPDGTSLGTKRGQDAAQEFAWVHATESAESDESEASGG